MTSRRGRSVGRAVPWVGEVLHGLLHLVKFETGTLEERTSGSTEEVLAELPGGVVTARANEYSRTLPPLGYHQYV